MNVKKKQQWVCLSINPMLVLSQPPTLSSSLCGLCCSHTCHLISSFAPVIIPTVTRGSPPINKWNCTKLLAWTSNAARSLVRTGTTTSAEDFLNTQNQFHKDKQTRIQQQEQINEQLRLQGPFTRSTNTASHWDGNHGWCNLLQLDWADGCNAHACLHVVGG